MTDNTAPPPADGMKAIYLRQIDVVNFLKSAGYEVPRACPKCSFDPWDEAFVNPEAPAANYRAKVPARMSDGHALSFICPNCGYTETFNAAPLINWKLTQHE